jgi:hypothetical protein
MFVYSQKIMQFIERLHAYITQILQREVGVQVTARRFLDHQKKISFPIVVVVYNNKKMVGYFDPHFYELGFHECLLYESEEKIKNIIRHELAHYLCFITHAYATQPHGEEFRKTCKGYGWGEEVWRATTCLEGATELEKNEQSAILRRVEKLLALSASANAHEAELAIAKSQELLLNHNLSSLQYETDDERVFLVRILEQKRETPKMRAIARILETFFVSSIFKKKEGGICLEIVGSRVNVEIAEYVAAFLEEELENLWIRTQKEHKQLKGQTAKNSFLLGVARGYIEKVEALNQSYEKATGRALIQLHNKLSDACSLVYNNRLQVKTRSTNFCKNSSELGQSAGKALTIRSGIKQSQTGSLFLS